MAQNFRRYTSNAVGTSAATLFTANSYDTVVGISLSNITGSTVLVDCYINDSSNDIYLVKSDRSAKLYPVDSWPSLGDRPDAIQITFVAGHTTKVTVPVRLIHGLKFLIGHYNENRQNVVVGPNVQKIPESYNSIVDKFKRYSF